MIYQESTYAITNALVATPEALLQESTILVQDGVITYVGKHDASLV